MTDLVLSDRPAVPQYFHQLGILVLDGSGSMSGQIDGRITKADAVNIAVRELLTRLIASKNSKDFSMAVITHDDNPSVHTGITRVKDENGNTIDDNANYNPMDNGKTRHGGGTDIGLALLEADRLAQQFLQNAPQGGVPHSVSIVVMSDGLSAGDPISIADTIKQNPQITICCALFAVKGEAAQGAQMLLAIASSPTQYKTVWDAETLRKFFVASVSAGLNVNIG